MRAKRDAADHDFPDRHIASSTAASRAIAAITDGEGAKAAFIGAEPRVKHFATGPLLGFRPDKRHGGWQRFCESCETGEGWHGWVCPVSVVRKP
jgi:hypothetical protein